MIPLRDYRQHRARTLAIRITAEKRAMDPGPPRDRSGETRPLNPERDLRWEPDWEVENA